MADVYWRHSKSGEVFAVRTNDAGEAIGVTGPLSRDEATVANYGNFDYDDEDAEWFNENESDFILHEPND